MLHVRQQMEAPAKGPWFAVLGPVRCWYDGGELDLGTPAQRAIIGLLLLREGQVVTADEIVDAVWGDDAPATVQGVLRTYVYRLRRLLSEATGGDSMIRSAGGGYVLPVPAEVVDFRLFDRYVAEARTAGGVDGLPRSKDLLERALGLWAGTALSGLRGPYLDHQRRRLEQDRFGAWEDRLAADVELGNHHAVIPELTAAVASQPLRERLRELQMLALYRAGRQAEALDVYAETRRTLDEELGVTPGTGLRRLHERILRMDPALDPPNSPGPAVAGPEIPVAPAQLPPGVPDFVGREAEIADIRRLLDASDRAPAVGLAGLGGLGKTTLAVHCGHLLRERFPDGQLFVDLGASGGTPAAAIDVLAAFLRACGVPSGTIPESLGERTALWRTVTAGKRVLVILDDAVDGEQIRHLLPAGAGSASIVTSWRHFIDLPAVAWLTVDTLCSQDALELLSRAAGQERIAAEPDAAVRLVAAFSYQPLAIRATAARMVDRPHLLVREVEDRLYEHLQQPAVIHGDCEVVFTPLSRTEAVLSDDVAAAFRLLAVPDCASVTAASAGAMLELSSFEAHALLEWLVDVHLLNTGEADTYHYHALVKAFARRRAREVEGRERCDRVLRNLAEFYETTSVSMSANSL